MAVRASDFIKLRGFDPTFVNGSENVDSPADGNELHRCCLYVPSAELIHYEGKLRAAGNPSVKIAEFFWNVGGIVLLAMIGDTMTWMVLGWSATII